MLSSKTASIIVAVLTVVAALTPVGNALVHIGLPTWGHVVCALASIAGTVTLALSGSVKDSVRIQSAASVPDCMQKLKAHFATTDKPTDKPTEKAE